MYNSSVSIALSELPDGVISSLMVVSATLPKEP